MMKYVCTNDCQERIDGKVTLIARDEVVDLKKAPANTSCFRKLGGENAVHKVDFATAKEEELLETEWKPSDLKAAAKNLYGVDMKVTGKSKEDLVITFLDARYRDADIGKIVNKDNIPATG